MGVASFLLSVWRSPPPLHAHPLPTPLHSLSSHLPPASDYSPRAATHISFTLSDQLFTWLQAMAMLHNYGSVHKSVRDLLLWASAGQDEDFDWLFCTPHEVPACIDLDLADDSYCDPVHEASCIAGKQAFARSCPQNMVTMDARVSDHLSHWIALIVSRYSLRGPSDVLDCVCRCAISLHAADDVFESDESGHDLPESTAELYHDLGIIRQLPTSVLSPSSPPSH